MWDSEAGLQPLPGHLDFARRCNDARRRRMNVRDAQPKTVYLSDYSPPAWLVDGVDLTVRLHPSRTRVTSRIRFSPNPTCPAATCGWTAKG
jgi:uncharacterized membrane-anchored protein